MERCSRKPKGDTPKGGRYRASYNVANFGHLFLEGGCVSGGGLTRNTTRTCSWSISTRLTSARMISRRVNQSASCSPVFTRTAKFVEPT